MCDVNVQTMTKVVSKVCSSNLIFFLVTLLLFLLNFLGYFMGVLGFPLFLFYMLCEALGSIITAVAHDLLVMFSGTG
jgi:hypothetical protein